MRIAVKSQTQDWHADGICVTYQSSRLNNTEEGRQRAKQFYEMSFTYDFKRPNDTVYFAYCLPYTYSKMQNHLKSLQRPETSSYLREEHLCYSLSGVSVPILTVTTHVDRCRQSAPLEIDRSDFSENELRPQHKYKKFVIVCARVHPGESNSSHIMHGFIDFITGSSEAAKDLRRKIVFKIVPMTNPDGVICGNYRTSLSGNDLNRQFLTPNPKLHPEICALRNLVA